MLVVKRASHLALVPDVQCRDHDLSAIHASGFSKRSFIGIHDSNLDPPSLRLSNVNPPDRKAQALAKMTHTKSGTIPLATVDHWQNAHCPCCFHQPQNHDLGEHPTGLVQAEEDPRPCDIQTELCGEHGERSGRRLEAFLLPHQPNRHHDVDRYPHRAEDVIWRIPGWLFIRLVPAFDLGRCGNGHRPPHAQTDDEAGPARAVHFHDALARRDIETFMRINMWPAQEEFSGRRGNR